MSPRTPPKPAFVAAEETSITIEITPDPDVISYDIYYKQNAQPWDLALCKTINAQDQNKIKSTVIELLPGTVYCIRLVAKDDKDENSEPGPEMICDTASVDCNNSSQCRCIIQ